MDSANESKAVDITHSSRHYHRHFAGKKRLGIKLIQNHGESLAKKQVLSQYDCYSVKKRGLKLGL